jgi:PDDEXK-like domain of unknown function (DUF3799)
MSINISQSLIGDVWDVNLCPHAIRLKYIQRVKVEPTEAMLKGNVFEYKLLGSTTEDGSIPELPKLVRGGDSADEKAINGVVALAQEIFEQMGIKIGRREYIVIDGVSGQLDNVAQDFLNPEKEAIYDVKFTETKFDDRWDGWADFEKRIDSQIQARHYVYLFQKKYGYYPPFYFLVFGKSGWVRVIKVGVSKEVMEVHEAKIIETQEKIIELAEDGFRPAPTYEKCRNCRLKDICEFRKTTPDIEHYIL